MTGRLFWTGTSITRPRTCDTIGTTYLTTLTSVVVGAKMFNRAIVAARTTTGKIATATFHGVVHGSSFSLMKISQTKNTVDAEQDDFH